MIAFLGRFCLSAIFIISGVTQIIHFREAQLEVMRVFTEWLVWGMGNWKEAPIEVAIDWSAAVLVVGIIFQLLGGLLLILGFKVRWGAFLLLIFTALASVMFHNFWTLQGPAKVFELIMFLKNFSIIGGLLLVIAFGTGARKEPRT